MERIDGLLPSGGNNITWCAACTSEWALEKDRYKEGNQHIPKVKKDYSCHCSHIVPPELLVNVCQRTESASTGTTGTMREGYKQQQIGYISA